MRRIISIAGLNLQQLFRNRGELVGTLVLPLLLTWVFGMAFGSGAAQSRITEIPFADADTSRYSKFVASTIDESDALKTVAVSEAEARRLVRDGDAPVAIIVRQGFGENVEHGRDARIVTIRDPGSTQAQAIVQVVAGATDRLAADAKAAHVAANALVSGADGVYPSGAPDFRELFLAADEFWRPDPPVGVRTEVVSASSSHSSELSAPASTQYSLGFTVYFVLMVSLGGAGGILEERELGTLRRLLATPASRSEIVSGKVAGVAAIGAFEAAVLVGFGALVFGVPWGNAPLAVVILLGSLVLASTGLGIMLSVLVKTRSQLSALVPIISTALAMLGGCYWPLEITSPFMQKLALLTPTGWAMVGLKNTVARGQGIESVLLPAGVLLAMAAVFFVVGLSRLRLE